MAATATVGDRRCLAHAGTLVFGYGHCARGLPLLDTFLVVGLAVAAIPEAVHSGNLRPNKAVKIGHKNVASDALFFRAVLRDVMRATTRRQSALTNQHQ